MGNTRTTGTEQYYTPTETAAALTELMVGLVENPRSRVWVEPAGGTGTFTSAMTDAGLRWVSWDIDPKAPGVKEADFLTLDVAELVKKYNGAVCLTNPPFGRNHSLSVPFFNQAARFCEYIGFIVPRSWRKWSVINRLDAHMHLIFDKDLSVTYQDEEGEELSDNKVLNTIFQVYQRRETKRERIEVEDRGYISKTTPEKADVALTVFGYGCGTARTSFERVPNTTQMFLKVSSPQVIQALKEIDFSGFSKNVAYVEALSMPEIRHCLNQWFDQQETRVA